MIVLILFPYETVFTTKRQKIAITVLWILSFAISITTYIYYDVTKSGSKILRIRNDFSTRGNASISIPPKKKESSCLKRFIKGCFWKDMSFVFSAVIIATDLLMIFCYSTIIYQMSYKSRKCKSAKSKKDEGLPLLCVFIASVFVIFTLPFAITKFYLTNVPFWEKFCLILSSGMNSTVYFFRHRMKAIKPSTLRKWKCI